MSIDDTCPHGRPLIVECAACAHEFAHGRMTVDHTAPTSDRFEPNYDREKQLADLKKQLIFSAVEAEMDRAMRKHGPMRTPHEAFGVIYEEFMIEFAAAMHANDREQARKEMIQVAAMACRFLYDLGSDNGGQ